jgi:hypothetical protein
MTQAEQLIHDALKVEVERLKMQLAGQRNPEPMTPWEAILHQKAKDDGILADVVGENARLRDELAVLETELDAIQRQFRDMAKLAGCDPAQVERAVLAEQVDPSGPSG